MITSEKIRNHLETSFVIGFEVSSNDANSFLIEPKGAEEKLFSIHVSFNDIRLKMSGEPQKYAADFVRLISQSNEYRRKCFCSIWKEIGQKSLSVKVNDHSVSQEEFIAFENTWKRFSISFNKAPYFDFDDENSQDAQILYYAKSMCDLFLTLFPYEIQGEDSEGSETKITVSKYERHPHNREICLRLHGYKCTVCGFDFEEVYGAVGHGFIEVHHVKPVSQFDGVEHFDPSKDLVPLCSNCHSMAHRRKCIPYSVEELKSFIKKRRTH